MSTLTKPLLSLTLAEILFNLSGYVIHAVAGRVLGPAEYGRYGLVITLTTTVIILIGNGIPTAMSRYLSEVFEKEPGKVHAVKMAGVYLQCLLIGAVTLLFFLLSPIISFFLGDPTLTPLFRFSSLIIPAFAASSFYFYYFTGIHRFHTQAILKMTRALLRVAIIVPCVILFKLFGAIAGYIAVPFLTFLLGIAFDRASSKGFRPDPSATFPKRELLATAWPITLFLVFYEIFISVDLYLVKAITNSDAQTGFYNAALALGRIPHYLFYALSIILLPALAKLKSDGDPERTTRVMASSLRYAGIILTPVALTLFAYAEPISFIFFGKDYLDSAPSLRILSFGLSFLTVFYLTATGLMGLGYAKLAMWLSIVGTVVNISLNGIAVPYFGILGAAWATTLSSVIITIAALIILQSILKIKYSFLNGIKTAIAGLVVIIGSILVPTSDWFFLLPATLSGILYFLILFFFGVITKEDVGPIQSFITKKKPVKHSSPNFNRH